MTTRDTVNPVWHLFDAATRHHNIRFSCQHCPHFAVYNAAGLWLMFEKKNWDEDLRTARDHFYCPACKRMSGRKIAPVMKLVDEPETVSLPLPDSATWKRAISRRR